MGPKCNHVHKREAEGNSTRHRGEKDVKKEQRFHDAVLEDRSDMATSQGMNSSLGLAEGVWPNQNLDFDPMLLISDSEPPEL